MTGAFGIYCLTEETTMHSLLDNPQLTHRVFTDEFYPCRKHCVELELSGHLMNANPINLRNLLLL